MGRDDFLFSVFSQAQFISFVTSTIDKQLSKDHKNRDRLLVANVAFNFQISSGIEKLFIDLDLIDLNLD